MTTKSLSRSVASKSVVYILLVVCCVCYGLLTDRTDHNRPRGKPDVSTRAKTDIIGGRERSHTNQSTRRHALRGLDHKDGESPSRKQVREDLENVREELKDRRYHDFSTTFTYQQPQAKALKRSLSALILRPMVEERSARLSRHLSFSLISDAVESKTDDVKYAESNDESELTQPAALVKIGKEQLRPVQHDCPILYCVNVSGHLDIAAISAF